MAELTILMVTFKKSFSIIFYFSKKNVDLRTSTEFEYCPFIFTRKLYSS